MSWKNDGLVVAWLNAIADSSAQLSLLSVLGRCMKWDEQYYDRRAS